MTVEEWCRLGGYTPEYARNWVWWINNSYNHGLPKQNITRKMAEAWANEALG